MKYLLTGISLEREYIPVTVPLDFPVGIYLEQPGILPRELKKGDFVFLGFKPLIIGFDDLALAGSPGAKDHTVTVTFRLTAKRQHPLATLALRKVEDVYFPSGTVHLYEGEHVKQSFVTGIHWFIHRIRHYFHNKPGNVKPSGSLYDQLIAAYSIPRLLSVVSVFDRGNYNFFPIDLDGDFRQGVYAIALRIGSKSTKQITDIRKILIARLQSDSYQKVLLLGRNHLAELVPLAAEISIQLSENLNFPMPTYAKGYIELELIRTIERGIHQIHFFKIIKKNNFDSEINHLGLLHRFCVQWYKKHNVVY